MKLTLNLLLYRYSFWHINNRQLLKILWKKEKLLVTSNISFFPQCFLHNQINGSPFVHISEIISIFAVNLHSLKLAYQVKGYPNYESLGHPGQIDSFLTGDGTGSICGQCWSRSDHTEHAVWSLIYTVHIFILGYGWTFSLSCNGSVF